MAGAGLDHSFIIRLSDSLNVNQTVAAAAAAAAAGGQTQTSL